MITLSKAITQRLAEIKMPAYKLADIVKIDRSYVSYITRRGLMPSVEIVMKMEKALKLKKGELLKSWCCNACKRKWDK